MKKGFTLLEVLVASVLMGMLVTILTVIFNQSAIAWRTGKAGVSDMTQTERTLSRIHAMADNVLPYTGGENYCVVSPWNDSRSDNSAQLNMRGVVKASNVGKKLDTVSGAFYASDAGKSYWKRTGLGNPKLSGGSAFIVGVRSAGPDRRFDTEDDISSWPDEVE